MGVGYDRPQIPFTAASASGGAGTPVILVFGRSSSSGAIPNDASAFLFDLCELWLTATGSGGAGSPTLDCKLQASFDGVNWVDANVSTAQIASASATTKVATGTRGLGVTPVVLGAHLRVVLTAGSASGTETFTGTVGLMERSLGT